MADRNRGSHGDDMSRDQSSMSGSGSSSSSSPRSGSPGGSSGGSQRKQRRVVRWKWWFDRWKWWFIQRKPQRLVRRKRQWNGRKLERLKWIDGRLRWNRWIGRTLGWNDGRLIQWNGWKQRIVRQQWIVGQQRNRRIELGQWIRERTSEHRWLDWIR